MKKNSRLVQCPKNTLPEKLNIEQGPSKIIAGHKAQVVSGKLLVGLTGGFGVDSYFFNKKIKQVFRCGIDKNLSEITAHINMARIDL